MFGKQVLEVCTIVAYWVLLIPTLFITYMKNEEFKNKPFDFFFTNSEYAVYVILGYLVTYRLFLYIFINLKKYDLRLWNRLPETEAKLKLQLEEAKSYYEHADCVDGPPATLHFSTRTLKKGLPKSPRPYRASPRLPRAHRANMKLELEEDYEPDDDVDGSPISIVYDTIPYNRNGPQIPPTIRVNSEVDIYECPTE